MKYINNLLQCCRDHVRPQGIMLPDNGPPTARARRRAKDIYIETLRASGGKPPSDQSIRDTHDWEGHKYYTTALIGQ